MMKKRIFVMLLSIVLMPLTIGSISLVSQDNAFFSSLSTLQNDFNPESSSVIAEKEPTYLMTPKSSLETKPPKAKSSIKAPPTSSKKINKELYLIEKAEKYTNSPKLFAQKVHQIADKLDVPADWIMALIHSESGFNPKRHNRKGSGAFGLIQLMPATCRELGIKKLSRSAVEQLDNVEKYLKWRQKRCGKYRSFTDLKLAVLYPVAVGKSKGYTLYSKPSIAYNQNSGLDSNRDGRVTVADIERKMRKEYGEVY